MQNRQIVLSNRPDGIPGPEHFSAKTTELDLTLAEGQIAVKNIYLSIDPAMRGWVSLEPNYLPPVQIDEVMRSICVGEIVDSKHPDYAKGDTVYGIFGWQEYCVCEPNPMVRKINPELAPISSALGALGPNGLTAYLVLNELGKIEAGETVLISTAAGGVGSIAGQIAKIKGCKVIGLTGSDDKVEMCVNEFGYDHALNYKTTENLEKAIAELAPEGINVFFDNTSGAIADAVYPNLAMNARALQVGTAAVESWEPETPLGPRRDRHILTKRLTVMGFVLIDHTAKAPAALQQLAQWYTQGELKYRENITEGLENAPQALADLYKGANTGKQLIKV
ncbi:NADP-dependent oxidoreductase [Thalassotalea euphylliae]|uniref:NADP-dependent oxidoreductase n=1 Tax=Thalassotalea euphylliae TaxID=1655234 RepID=A0A3E0U4B7_9GAMM|nr:NADP-dependent oxidoreductase [Thalassotalea euphylliae]REL31841.1 NADP-dependent oxidoreductase [Thalassotalea euphylliae]